MADRDAPAATPGPRSDGLGAVRANLVRLLPEGGRGRRLVGWGVVAWTTIGIAVLIWVAGRALGRIAGLIPYLVMAWLVVFLLGPAARWLAARRVPYRIAATAVFLMAVGITALVLALMIPALVRQTGDLFQNSLLASHGGGTLFDRLSHASNPLIRKVGDGISNWVEGHAGNVQAYLRTVTGAGLQLAHAGLILMIGGFLGYLLLLSQPAGRELAGLVPANAMARIEVPLAEVRRIVGGYVRARLIVSTVVGVLATLGLWLIHMPFWLPLGIFVGVANLIPMLGTWIGGVPVGLVALLTKPPSFLVLVLVVIAVSHIVDGYFLSPIVLKETTHLHPVVVVLAVLLGAELAGFWGILAAIPVAGIVQFGLKRWLVPRLQGATADAPPDVGTVT